MVSVRVRIMFPRLVQICRLGLEGQAWRAGFGGGAWRARLGRLGL